MTDTPASVLAELDAAMRELHTHPGFDQLLTCEHLARKLARVSQERMRERSKLTFGDRWRCTGCEKAFTDIAALPLELGDDDG